jgi:hypothetical protein
LEVASELLGHPANSSAPTDVVVLVHGTYQPEAAWTLPGSSLATALRGALPSTAVYRFRWSGRNSHQARLDAGDALSRALAGLAQVYGDRARIHVVTHSHGGNVLMYALARWSPGLIESGVCLATPFLYVRDAGSRLTNWARAFIALLAPLGILAVVTAALFAARADLYVGAALLSAIGVLATTVLGAYLIVLLGTRARASKWNFALPTLEQGSLLILRPIGDEAAAALGAAHLASLTLETIWRHGRRLVEAIVAFALAVIVIVGVVAGAAERLGVGWSGLAADAQDLMLNAFVLGEVIVALGLVGVLTVMALCQLPFGPDALALTLRAITTVEDSPPGNQTVRQVVLDRVEGGGLEHSRLYEDPSVIDAVVAFISRAVDDRFGRPRHPRP